MALILCCILSTAQNTDARIDPVTGEVIIPFEKAQTLANITVDRATLQDKVKELELKLELANKALDSLEQIHLQTIENHNQFLIADRLRDQQIDDVATEEISVWRGMSRGLSLSANLNTQVYNFVPDTATSPLSISARLALSGDRFSFAIIPFTGMLQLPSNETILVGGAKLSLGYKFF